ANIVIGGPMFVEVLFPAIAKSAKSPCTIYVQTSSGRKKYGKPIPADSFDPNVPGTIRLARPPGDAGAPEVPAGYREVIVRGNPYALTALDDGRFTFSVPVKLGSAPDKTLIHVEEDRGTDEGAEELALAVNGEDEIFVGLNFKDNKGKQHWVTRRATLSGDFFFDVMDRRYRENVEGLYVGENLYFRVIDPTRDSSDQKELIAVELTTESGKTKKLELVETYSHSGVFKGLVKVVHADDKGAGAETGVIPAVYGDKIAAAYAQPRTKASVKVPVTVFKGSDGKVVPFTKRFKDPAIAVETQFMIAEAYFELAKRHRELKQDSLARREIAQGRKLLEEAIRDYPHTSARAQAEYLLADLSLEFGNDAVDPDARKKHYMDAIARYSDIVATYPDSEYAPKAQYRKALAYEKMEMLDEACEEYVKLSYRYPDNPLVAETIARLGQYFLNKGRGIRAEMEKMNKETEAVKREKTRLKAVDMFKTAAQVFGRLGARFPNHRLAGKTMLLSAQCFMQAEDYKAAVKGYTAVVKTPDMDKDLVAEAMYWCGHSYMEINDLVKAYQVFKKLTWDYPASKWAKFARGRLADEKLANIEE
ncbi:MAG: tetratricopeptide repeat protein, partial [Phycisphaerae bacterium]